MIKTFIHKGLKEFWETGKTKGNPANQASKIHVRLSVINAAQKIEDCDRPGFKLHQLGGNRKGIWSITVTGNYRITFQFRDGDAYIVNYEDYH
jgi:toxin HigB-1